MKNSNKKKSSIKTRGLNLFAAFLVPLGPSDNWKNYSFNNIKPNKVTFSEGALTINVNHSASPLLYNLPQTLKTQSIQVQANIKGPLHPLPTGAKQGEKQYDDFVLRVGLILKGKEKLSWLQRRVAPGWLIEMEKQLPENLGIDKVLFFTTCRQKDLLNKERSHFLSSKLAEKCVTLLDQTGDFTIDVKLPKNEDVIGIWLASDGDDIQQKFQLTVKKIELNYNKKSL